MYGVSQSRRHYGILLTSQNIQCWLMRVRCHSHEPKLLKTQITPQVALAAGQKLIPPGSWRVSITAINTKIGPTFLDI